MTEKRELYVRLIQQGVSNSAACRSLGIDRKTGHWWKNGGVVVRNRVIAPGRVIVLLTVFAKTRPNERREVDRAKRALQRCMTEHGLTGDQDE